MNFSKILCDKLADAEVIAKSAVHLTIDRSTDLDQNPVFALIMVEVLCKTAINDFCENHSMLKDPQMAKAMDDLRSIIGSGLKEKFSDYKAKAKASQ